MGTSNKDWWPNRLNLNIPLRSTLLPFGSMDRNSNCGEELKLNLQQEGHCWSDEEFTRLVWFADYGHYGPLFIRMAWHSAGLTGFQMDVEVTGTGNQRFAPVNSWPDNTNLDKGQVSALVVKKKYWKKALSLGWPDDSCRKLRPWINGFQNTFETLVAGERYLGTWTGYLLGFRNRVAGWDKRYSGTGTRESAGRCANGIDLR